MHLRLSTPVDIGLFAAECGVSVTRRGGLRVGMGRGPRGSEDPYLS